MKGDYSLSQILHPVPHRETNQSEKTKKYLEHPSNGPGRHSKVRNRPGENERKIPYQIQTRSRDPPLGVFSTIRRPPRKDKIRSCDNRERNKGYSSALGPPMTRRRFRRHDNQVFSRFSLVSVVCRTPRPLPILSGHAY